MDLFEDMNSFDEYDIIISNPPYIPAEEYMTLPEEIREFEPAHALTDFKDGLSFYRMIIELSQKTKNKTEYLLEIGDNKKEAVGNLFTQSGFINHRFIKDLNNLPRVIHFSTGK
jgi:release factor glutamine methyltransferase